MRNLPVLILTPKLFRTVEGRSERGCGAAACISLRTSPGAALTHPSHHVPGSFHHNLLFRHKRGLLRPQVQQDLTSSIPVSQVRALQLQWVWFGALDCLGRKAYKGCVTTDLYLYREHFSVVKMVCLKILMLRRSHVWAYDGFVCTAKSVYSWCMLHPQLCVHRSEYLDTWLRCA